MKSYIYGSSITAVPLQTEFDLAGNQYHCFTGPNFIVAKMSSDGTQIWAKTYSDLIGIQYAKHFKLSSVGTTIRIIAQSLSQSAGGLADNSGGDFVGAFAEISAGNFTKSLILYNLCPIYLVKLKQIVKVCKFSLSNLLVLSLRNYLVFFFETQY